MGFFDFYGIFYSFLNKKTSWESWIKTFFFNRLFFFLSVNFMILFWFFIFFLAMLTRQDTTALTRVRVKSMRRGLPHCLINRNFQFTNALLHSLFLK